MPGKDPKDVKSYRPISLSPIIAKLLEKLILRRIDPDFTTSDWIPRHQFGFRQAHSTIQRCHRITHTILKVINNKEYLTSVFLDVSQAFDRVWHPGLLYKVKNRLSTFFPLLKSYLSNRQFRMRVKGAVSAVSYQFWRPSGQCPWTNAAPPVYIRPPTGTKRHDRHICL